MALLHLGQPSFAAGELAPAMYGRIDLAKYHVGAALVKNWLILPQGGAMTRPGQSFVGEVIASATRSRLLPFQFRSAPSGQNYILEFGELKMRVIMNGGYVLDTSSTITSITQANPGVVTTAAAHGLTTGNEVFHASILGMTYLNNRRLIVTVLSATTYSIGVDTSAYPAYVSGGTAGRVYTIVSPYAAADLPVLKHVQSQDTMYLTHPSYAPRKLVRTGHAAWTFTSLVFAPETAAPVGLSHSAGAGATASYVVTAVNDDSGEESLQSAAYGSAAIAGTLTWTAVAGCSKYNVYRAKNGIYGFVGNATQAAGFTDVGTLVPDTTDTPPQQRNPFSGASDYPGCATFHDGRQWFARTDNKPQTFWASQSAYIGNMSTSEPTRDSDAITRTIASREVNEIRHLLSFGDLICFTSGSEFRIQASQGTLTPADCSARAQGYTGSNHMAPIAQKSSILYVNPVGKKVLDVAYEFNSDSWNSRDMSILSEHLFHRYELEEWAYAKDPYSIIYCVRDDGVLLALTYLKEHDVYAWTQQHTDGEYESVASIQEDSRTVLYAIVKRTIGGNTVRYVERQVSREWDNPYEVEAADSFVSYDGWNTDTAKKLKISGATYNQGDTVTLTAQGHTPFTAASVGKRYLLKIGDNQVNVTVTAYTSTSIVSSTLDFNPHTSLEDVYTDDWALGITELSGLWHLNGETPCILADGSVVDLGSAVIENGFFTLPRPAGKVVAGLSYICDLQTLDIETPGPDNIQGLVVNVGKVVLKVESTRGLQLGPTFDTDDLVQMKERESENYGIPTELQNGTQEILIPPDWKSNGRVCIRQEFPLPATVVGLFPTVDVADA